MGRSSGCIVPAKSFIRCSLWGTAALLSTNTSTEDRRRGHDHQRRRVDRRPMSRKAIGRATPPIAETLEPEARDAMRFARRQHPVLPTSLAWGNNDALPSHGGIVGY